MLVSVDIGAVFLPATTLDQDVFVQPHDDLRKDGVILRFKVKDTFMSVGLEFIVAHKDFINFIKMESFKEQSWLMLETLLRLELESLLTRYLEALQVR